MTMVLGGSARAVRAALEASADGSLTGVRPLRLARSCERIQGPVRVLAAMLLAGFGLTPRGGARRPPWRPCRLTRRLPDGRLQRLHVQDERLEVEHDGRPVA